VTKIFIVWSYVVALWSTLIVPCVTVPENWKYCSKDLDVWLYPELVRGWDLITGREVPYQSEQEALQSQKGN
jgi:hypothetical protein